MLKMVKRSCVCGWIGVVFAAATSIVSLPFHPFCLLLKVHIADVFDVKTNL